MDSKIPTSFIPKDTIRTDLRPKREPMGILSVLALVILAGSLVYLAGAYVYRYVVYQEINNPCPAAGENGQCGLKESLTVETRGLQREKLEQLKSLDTKLKNGTRVLNQHIAMRPLFDLLARTAGQNIQYQKFQFDKTGVVLSGAAKSYEDIAFQQKVFSTDAEAMKKIRNFAFSDFDLDNKGQVSFKLSLVVDPSLLSYSQYSQSQ
jgi:hypothetical protein